MRFSMLQIKIRVTGKKKQAQRENILVKIRAGLGKQIKPIKGGII